MRTEFVGKMKTHSLCLVTSPHHTPENRAVFEITWKNNVQRGRPQMTIWRMGIACWIPKATKTQSEYVILRHFAGQQWLLERTSLLHLCSHCLSCFLVLVILRFLSPERELSDVWCRWFCLVLLYPEISREVHEIHENSGFKNKDPTTSVTCGVSHTVSA